MTIETMAFVFGLIMLAVAILGGGFEVKEVKVSNATTTVRVLAGVVGILFTGVGLLLKVGLVQVPASTPSPNQQSAQTPVPPDPAAKDRDRRQSAEAAPPTRLPLIFRNAQTGKCLTIAGGGGGNNVEGVQFDCDDDQSRRWTLNRLERDVYEIINERTKKCLTIAGGRSTDNSLPTVQYDCDRDPSRTWKISDVTATGLYQVRNVQTDKCLTIEGGMSPANNLRAVQFNCDGDLSRRWTIKQEL